jgi:hypothetical protein
MKEDLPLDRNTRMETIIKAVATNAIATGIAMCRFSMVHPPSASSLLKITTYIYRIQDNFVPIEFGIGRRGEGGMRRQFCSARIA